MLIHYQASDETMKGTYFSKCELTVSCDNRNIMKENMQNICISLSHHFNLSVTLHGKMEESFVLSLFCSISRSTMKHSARLKFESVFKEKGRLWFSCKNFEQFAKGG